MYTLTCLDNPWSALNYQSFTFPLFRPRLKTLKPQGSTVAIAAISDTKEPLGLAIAEIDLERKDAEINSVFVAPQHRNQGIGTALLAGLEEELNSRGCLGAHLVYITGQATTNYWERLLEKNHWTPPEPRMLVCKCDRKMLTSDWFNKGYRLPSAYTIFPWMEITPEERNHLQQQQETNPWIPPELVPFQHEENLEPLNSLGLRYQGEVVGWVITHRLAPDTIRYTCGYIRPDLQRSGRLLCLLAESIKRHGARPEIDKAIWATSFVFSGLINFEKNRMGPYLTSLEESRGSQKSFVPQ